MTARRRCACASVPFCGTEISWAVSSRSRLTSGSWVGSAEVIRWSLVFPGTYFVDEVNGRRRRGIFFTIGAGGSRWPVRASASSQRAGVRRRWTLPGLILFDRPVAAFSDVLHPNHGYRPGPVTTLDGLVAGPSEQQGWAEVTAPSDISIDGYVGKAFERTAPPTWCTTATSSSTLGENSGRCAGLPRFPKLGAPDPEGWAGVPGLGTNRAEIETLWILDIDGTVVVISAEPFPEASAADHAEFAAVLDSIRIERA